MSTRLIATRKANQANYVLFLEAVPMLNYFMLQYSIYRNDVLVHKETCSEEFILKKFNAMVDMEIHLSSTVGEGNPALSATKAYVLIK